MSAPRSRRILMIGAALTLGVGPLAGSTCRAEPPAPPVTSAEKSLLERRAAELTIALREYRDSLARLLVLHEQSLARALEKQRAWQDLYERGALSRRELQQAAEAVATVQGKAEQTTREITAAEHAIAEGVAAEALAALPPPGPGAPQRTETLVRYQGHVVWSLPSVTPRLRQIFAARFGHDLPISAYGQTPLHDRMGFDHSNALDVALHPESPEGRALIDYLTTEGIPFIAYNGAVPGAASGAHIHVGRPSPRITAVTRPDPRRP